MKKKILLFGFPFLLIALIFPIYNQFSKYQSLKKYDNTVKNFIPVSNDQLDSYNKLSNNDYLLYFGRKTCSYCRDFVPTINIESKKRNLLVFYIDTENTEENTKLSNLRNTLNIEYVPSVIFISKESVNLFNDELQSFQEFLDKIT